MAPHQPPSLQQALAVALLVRKRSAAAAAEAAGKAAKLEEEVQALRAAAAAPGSTPPQLPPLAQLVAPPAGHLSAPGGLRLITPRPPAGAPSPDAEVAERLESLHLWHQATPLLPDDRSFHQALAAAQRYVLLKELEETPAGSLPALAALNRSPVKALLELASDILSACAAGDGATSCAACAISGSPTQQQTKPQSSQEKAQQPACPVLSPSAHAPLLTAAVATAVHLCCWPGQGAGDECYGVLQQFCKQALDLACAPHALPQSVHLGSPAPAICTPTDGQDGGSGSGAAEPAFMPIAAAPAGIPLIDLTHPSCQVARRVLGLLQAAPSTGMVLLSCAAPGTRDCMAALVTAVLGDPALAQQPSVGSIPGIASWQPGPGSMPSGVADSGAVAEGAGEEARLVHAFGLLSQQLSAGLRQLPLWVRAMGLQDEAFLQELAASVLSARDAAQLISLSHPAAARQMQRVAAQMIAALQQLASFDPCTNAA